MLPLRSGTVSRGGNRSAGVGELREVQSVERIGAAERAIEVGATGFARAGGCVTHAASAANVSSRSSPPAHSNLANDGGMMTWTGPFVELAVWKRLSWRTGWGFTTPNSIQYLTFSCQS